MKLKTLSATAIGTAIIGNVTKEDIFFIISVIITVLNLIIEYLRQRKNDQLEKSESSP